MARGAVICTKGLDSLDGVLERVGGVEASSVDGRLVPFRRGVLAANTTLEECMKPLERSLSLGGVVARALSDCIVASWDWPSVVLSGDISGLRGKGVQTVALSIESVNRVEGAGDMMSSVRRVRLG